MASGKTIEDASVEPLQGPLSQPPLALRPLCVCSKYVCFLELVCLSFEGAFSWDVLRQRERSNRLDGCFCWSALHFQRRGVLNTTKPASSFSVLFLRAPCLGAQRDAELAANKMRLFGIFLIWSHTQGSIHVAGNQKSCVFCWANPEEGQSTFRKPRFLDFLERNADEEVLIARS